MWIFVSLMLLVLAAFVALNTNTVQRRIAQQAAVFLSEEIGSAVSVGDASFSLFNQIELYDVKIEDQAGDTLLFVKELDAKFELLQFLKNNFIFQHFRIINMYACLKNDLEKGNNFDFIVEALKSDDTQSKNIFYEFKSIQLVDSHITYTSNRAEPKSGVFDANNLDIRNLNTKLSINYLNNDSLSLHLIRLCFTEKSGLEVKNFSTVISADQAGAKFEDFVLQLPRTTIQTGALSFDYRSFDNFKHFADSVDFEIFVKPSDVYVCDFAAFLPKLKNINQKFNISGSFTGSLSKLLCPTLKITYGNATQLVGYFEFNGFPDIENTYLSAGISNLTCTKNDVENLVANITSKPFQLPPLLQFVEKFKFHGETKGYLTKNITTVGSIKTNLGQIDADFSLKRQQKNNIYEYHGSVKTNDFQLGRLLNKKEMDNITFNLNLNGTQTAKQPADFDVQGLVSTFSYNNYIYNNITLDGHYNQNKFNGQINLDDENGKVQIDGLLDFSQELPYYDFTAKVQNLQPAKMNLIEKYPELMFSFNINANARGNNLDNLAGNIFANNIHLKNGKKELIMKKLEVISDISDSLSGIVIASDFLNGIIEGKYTFSTIVSSIQYVASQYIPALSNAKNDKERKVTDNNFDFDLKIENSDTITNFLGIEWQANGIINMFGFYDDYTQKFRLRTIVPELVSGRWSLLDINFTCENPAGKMNLALDFNAANNKQISMFDVYLRLQAENNKLNTQLQWTNNEENNGFYGGEILASTIFERNENNELTTVTDIFQSNFILSDTLWSILPAVIETGGQKITVKDFVLSNQTQNITINGIASKSEKDRIEAVLKNVDLGVLEQFIVMDFINFGGIVSAKASISRVLDNPIFQISVSAKDFTFNKCRWGDVTLYSVWQGEQERLAITGGIKDKGKFIAGLSGHVYPKKNIDLDIKINADSLKIGFLQPFLKNVMTDVSGYASTKNLRMLGSINKPLFEGNIVVKGGTFGIDYLKTNYSFSDTIKMTRNTISFKDVTIYDSEKNSGKASGNVRHELYQNFIFNINGHFSNILGLNTQEKDNEDFYGKVYGTGNFRITGNSSEIIFDISAKTERHSHLTIPFASYQKANENNFITFVQQNQDQNQQRIRTRRTQRSAEASIKVNLQIDATPDGEIRLIVDPIAGDMIKATGNGSLRISYNRQSDIKMYGTYIINTGLYHFTLQDVIQKNFKIKEGSTIIWNGSPYAADVNINAYYPVSASLRDLLDDVNATVKVNCLLKLTGDLMTPNIKFDIEFPGSNPDLVQRVRNVIDSEDMMNRQMLYLLAMDCFYRPDYLNSSTQASNNSGLSMVSSTLSSQLNSLLSQMSDKFTMGVNYRQSADGADVLQEYEASFGGKTLDDRLIINGSVGYRNDVNNPNNNFIGDFDIEYIPKFSKSGKFRIKTYSHSNNKYYLRNANSTQGVGVVFREEFDTFGGLVQGYWDRIFHRKKEEKNEIK